VKILSIFALLAATLLPPCQSQAIQDGNVSILKFTWQKERLPGWETNRAGETYETYDTMRNRIASERRLQQARNSGNKSEVAKAEKDLKVREQASAPKDKPEKTAPPKDGYRYRVWIRNTSEKIIRSVDWDYLFFDPETQQELACHQFTSDEKIRPGKDKELQVFILTPPVRVTNAHGLGTKERPFVENVRIVRIEYSDGSVWQHP
jgi:hypothetical protein